MGLLLERGGESKINGLLCIQSHGTEKMWPKCSSGSQTTEDYTGHPLNTLGRFSRPVGAWWELFQSENRFGLYFCA